MSLGQVDKPELLDITEGRAEFRTIEDAQNLAILLAKQCPDYDRVLFGLRELMINAVEHGNLEIGYEKKAFFTRKTDLKRRCNGFWRFQRTEVRLLESAGSKLK